MWDRNAHEKGSRPELRDQPGGFGLRETATTARAPSYACPDMPHLHEGAPACGYCAQVIGDR